MFRRGVIVCGILAGAAGAAFAVEERGADTGQPASITPPTTFDLLLHPRPLGSDDGFEAGLAEGSPFYIVFHNHLTTAASRSIRIGTDGSDLITLGLYNPSGNLVASTGGAGSSLVQIDSTEMTTVGHWYYRIHGVTDAATAGIDFVWEYGETPAPIEFLPIRPLIPSGDDVVHQITTTLSEVGTRRYFKYELPYLIQGPLTFIMTQPGMFNGKFQVFSEGGAFLAFAGFTLPNDPEVAVLNSYTRGQQLHVMHTGQFAANVSSTDASQFGTYSFSASVAKLALLYVDEDGDGYDGDFEVLLGTLPGDETSKPTFGDMNGDGVVNMADALRLHRRSDQGIFGNPLFYEAELDIDGNYSIQLQDAVSLYAFTTGRAPMLPVPPVASR